MKDFLGYAILAVVTPSISMPGVQQIPNMPAPELERILQSNDEQTPWMIEEVGFERDGSHWTIEVYRNPREIESDLCVASLAIYEVDRRGETYVVVGKPAKSPPRKIIAWSRCSRAKRNLDFAEFEGTASDADLLRAMHAARRLLGVANPPASVKFEDDGLRQALVKAGPADLYIIEARADSIALSFVVKGLFPDLLDIVFDLRGNEVSRIERGNGPDITSAASSINPKLNH
jgi:hypothetical protein